MCRSGRGCVGFISAFETGAGKRMETTGYFRVQWLVKKGASRDSYKGFYIGSAIQIYAPIP